MKNAGCHKCKHYDGNNIECRINGLEYDGVSGKTKGGNPFLFNGKGNCRVWEENKHWYDFLFTNIFGGE